MFLSVIMKLKEHIFFSLFKTKEIRIVACDFLHVSIKDQYWRIKYESNPSEYELRRIVSTVWVNSPLQCFVFTSAI